MACGVCKNMELTPICQELRTPQMEERAVGTTRRAKKMLLMSHVPSPMFVLRLDLLKSLVRFPPGKDDNKNQHDLVQGYLDLGPCAGHKHGHLV